MRWLTSSRQALREFAIVVAGVLAALAAQAWWEHRSERSHERAYLRQLYADTRENEARLNTAIAEDSAAGAATTKMLRALEGKMPQPAPDSVMEWVSRAGSSAEFRPLLGTYQALLGTGDIRLIRNDSLRAMLISYATSLEGEDRRLTQIRSIIFDMAPGFAREVPFLRGVFTGDMELTTAGVEALLRNEEASVIMFTMQAANVNRMNGFRRIREETLRLRSVLEEEPLLRRQLNTRAAED